MIVSFPSVGRTNKRPDAIAFCRPAGKGGPGLGGDAFSGLTVSAATVAGRRAGSVARLALSLSLGATSSSSFIFFGSGGVSSTMLDVVLVRLVESSESLLELDSLLLTNEVDDEDGGLC